MKQEVNRYNSRNTQTSLIPDLSKRIEILEDEQYLFLPNDWINDEELIVLKFRAEQKKYKIEYADSAPKTSTQLIFEEIEKAINIVTGLNLQDYALRDRTTHLFYVRVIYVSICFLHRIEKEIISKRLKKSIKTIEQIVEKHEDLFMYTPEYRRNYNDVMQIITNNQVIDKV
ncbi:hypothetical protein HXZ94_15695 [Empedobacter falsenii]|uniref:hypothetical protein n=1 Tax=Empedobacter falsenii TaxID=343874 RepID=UPI00257765E5|nr:hypothetical protein [Empedobacter falsenii]MDM1299939.1 hypothetical protein [Empedobacter falsenii]MDM1319732.1 hypothetical protein [Empedobacter falsenii]